jgi:prepilin-type N-terminal cleavage/methylation domain-containing protein
MKQKSFTLLELVIVVVIVAVLAGLGITQYQKVIWTGRFAEVYNTIGVISRAKAAYYLQYGNYQGVPPYTDPATQFHCGHGYGSTQVQRDLGIDIPSSSYFNYSIYPYSGDGSTVVWFADWKYYGTGGWAWNYNYVTGVWTKVGTSTTAGPACDYFTPQ